MSTTAPIVVDYNFSGRDTFIYEKKYNTTYISFLPAELRQELLIYRHSTKRVLNTYKDFGECYVLPYSVFHLHRIWCKDAFTITFRLDRDNGYRYEKFLDDVMHRRKTVAIEINFTSTPNGIHNTILSFDHRNYTIKCIRYHDEWIDYIHNTIPVTTQLLNHLLEVPVNVCKYFTRVGGGIKWHN